MQIEKQLSCDCSPAPPGLTPSVCCNAAHASSTPARRQTRCGVQGAQALCPQWVYETCWADKFNHKKRVRTRGPSMWFSGRWWETDEALEEAVEEHAAHADWAGGILKAKGLDLPCEWQGGAWAGRVTGVGLNTLQDLPSAVFCPHSSSPVGWWGSLSCLGLGLNAPLLRALPWLFHLCSSPLHCAVLCQGILLFPASAYRSACRCLLLWTAPTTQAGTLCTD